MRQPEGQPSLGSIALVGAIGLALLAAVGAMDWLTGPQLDFSLFYLIPVCATTWYAGSRAGYVASILSAVVWLMVDRLTGSRSANAWIVEWNFVARMAFFAGSVALIQAWRDNERRLSRMVEQRTSALRKLAAQLSAAEDEQRRKLAYDMHDALSQSLSVIKMNLDAAQLQPSDRSEVGARLHACGEMIDEVIRQTRTLMFDLHPAMLDDLGLVPTLQSYVKEFADRTGAELAVSEHGLRQPLPAPIANYLFRSVKELVSNASRHGMANVVIVAVHWEENALRIVVDDDGCGFDEAAVTAARLSEERRGLGLAGIDERISSMGGRITIESRPQQGSRVILEVPIESATHLNRKEMAGANANSVG